MTVESASTFLVGTVLYSIGYLVILIGVITANNLIFKYWKSFGWNLWPLIGNNGNVEGRFMTEEELNQLNTESTAPKRSRNKGEKNVTNT